MKQLTPLVHLHLLQPAIGQAFVLVDNLLFLKTPLVPIDKFLTFVFILLVFSGETADIVTFGKSTKRAVDTHNIGMYGNGLKS